MLRQVFPVVFLLVAWSAETNAQGYWCPPGSRPVRGGGGTMCLCPDGSYADIDGCRGPARRIPRGTVSCGNGMYCDPGMQCASNNRCIPAGSVDCGTYACNPGTKCSSAGCIAEDASDCGNQRYCEAGYKCSRDGMRCLAQDSVDCGSYSCSAGYKCKKQGGCVPKDYTECGTEYCKPGIRCSRDRICLADEFVSCGDGTYCSAGKLCAGPDKCDKDPRPDLWKRMGVPTSGPSPINKEKVHYDWPSIQLAGAAYNNKLKPGDMVFENNQDWKVLDRRTDPNSGFSAYTFVNVKQHRMVVGIQGTNPASVTDLSSDVAAIARGEVVKQATLGEQYIKDIRARFGNRYSVDCSGHSLGGYVCAYAAAQVPGVHAVTINPISSGSLATNNAYLIDNYITPADVADISSRSFERGLTGWTYKIEPPAALATPITSAESTPPMGEPGAITKHSVNDAIIAIGTSAGLAPFKLRH